MRKMKDSGVALIGEIPENWKVLKLRHIFDLSTGLSITKAEFVESGIKCVNYGDIHSKYSFDLNILRDKLNCVDEKHLKNKPSALAREGDFVFCDTSEDIEGSGNCLFVRDTNGQNVLAGSHTILGKPKQDIHSPFVGYLLKSKNIKSQIQRSVVGIKVFSITQKILKDINLIIPEIDEQVELANYLDYKVSLIDNVIEKTKKSIEEYRKYKKSLITETVTKGLNSGVQVKDSGVEWIGEIPEHWDSVKLKYIFEITKRIAGEIGYDILSVTQNGLKIKDITSNEGQLSADYSKYQFVYKNDFVMNHMDLLTGWVDLSQYNGVTSPDYRVFKMREGTNNSLEYYKLIFQICYTNKIFFGLGQGVSNLGRWRLQTDKFVNFEIPLPPVNEQIEIASFLSEKLKEIDSFIQKKESLLSELESYKRSLIYEVVTGKKEIN